MPLSVSWDIVESHFQQGHVHGSKISSTTENTVDRLDSRDEKNPESSPTLWGAIVNITYKHGSQVGKLISDVIDIPLDHGIGCICLEGKTRIFMGKRMPQTSACHQSLTVSWYSLKWQLSTIHWYMTQINSASRKSPKLTPKSRKISI